MVVYRDVYRLSTALLVTSLSVPALYAISHLVCPSWPSSTGLRVYPGLDALPAGPVRDKALEIYGEDFWPGGGWYSGPYGKVRYWLLGPENGKKVVLIHGLSVPAIIWKDVIPFLSKGYRVLVYDLHGRGHTSAPDASQIPYTVPLYTTQLALLMQHLGWEKAHIAGVSMGGAIAIAFAKFFPALVNKVALVCPVGLLDAKDFPRTMRVMSAPLLQTMTNSRVIRYLRQPASIKTLDSGGDPIATLGRIQSAYLPGYSAAIASSLRDGPVRGQEEAYAALGKSGKSVLLVWGTEDTDAPYRYSHVARALIPQAQLVAIEGGPHDVTLSHPEIVGAALVKFFGE